MVELCRGNDPAGLSWMRVPFAAAAAGHGVVFDSHGGGIEDRIGAFRRAA